MENRAVYKQVKNFIINWWIFLIVVGMIVGFHVWMIFAYLHQWGNNPIDRGGLIFLSLIWFFIYIIIGRKLIKIITKK